MFKRTTMLVKIASQNCKNSSIIENDLRGHKKKTMLSSCIAKGGR